LEFPIEEGQLYIHEFVDYKQDLSRFKSDLI